MHVEEYPFMAVKKSEIYQKLWDACDALRGSMDASQYKNYVLTLLFVKYVSDKYAGVPYATVTIPPGGSFADMVALKGSSSIGEGMNKVIGALADSNDKLAGIFTDTDFNSEEKFGKGKEKTDTLTTLVGIFQDSELNFKNNRAGNDDILGDAYEYLMRQFAAESGKSKGQFYTPAEVSRILAAVIGIDEISRPGKTVYDPACGSGSLLIRAADAAPKKFNVAGYGQEKDGTTAGLAKMNTVLHSFEGVQIVAGNTFSNPLFKDGKGLKRFDFAVVNPPFSLKNWTDGVNDPDLYGRFEWAGSRPPQKNGDFAWVMHVLASLKEDGRGAMILPFGVLFRGNAEEDIRKAILQRGYIEGVIGLPPNLFYGVSIPACILILNKATAAARTGLFLIDAGKGFKKDGPKNRLREQDIFKIIRAYRKRLEIPGFSRFVPMSEIEANGWNLNLPRYIDNSEPEDEESIEAHLLGGIPAADIDAFVAYWREFASLKSKLFHPGRKGFYSLVPPKDSIREDVLKDPGYLTLGANAAAAAAAWAAAARRPLTSVTEATNPKAFVAELGEGLFKRFEPIPLVDPYDAYEVLLSYWRETLEDDIHILMQEGYAAAKEVANLGKTDKKGKTRVIGWEGVLVPKALVIARFFAAERQAADAAAAKAEELESKLAETAEEQGGEDGPLADCMKEGDSAGLDPKLVEAAAKAIRKSGHKPDADNQAVLDCAELIESIKRQRKEARRLADELDAAARAKYPALSDKEALSLLLDDKWFATVTAGIQSLVEAVGRKLADRLVILAERYEETLPSIEARVAASESKVKADLERMGFKW